MKKTTTNLMRHFTAPPIEIDAHKHQSLGMPSAHFLRNYNSLWHEANRLQLKIGTSIVDRSYGLRDFVLVDPAGFGLRFAQALQP